MKYESGVNYELKEVYFKGTPEAINQILNWWKNSNLELGKDIQVVDLNPQLKEDED